jgi:RsiW-degrading membrane proteinase PrsW (M82 family)
MSDPKPPIDLPPVPKGIAQAQNSEIIPFKSTKIDLKKSPLTYAVGAIGLLTLFMWGQMDQLGGPDGRRAIIAFVLGAIGAVLISLFAVIYLYAKSDKPIWAFAFPALVLGAILMTPLGTPFFYVFREILPGDTGKIGQNPSVVSLFIAMLFGAGLMEELMKAVPVLIGAALAFNAAKWRSMFPPRLYDALTVRGPLDGLLFGVAAGAMFILLETGLQYTGGKVTQGDPGAVITGLLLMVPRTMGGVIGHMAYAGITGYFIGLAVLRPQLPRAKLMLGGWVVAAVLHAIWNTSGAGGAGLLYLSAALTGALFVACLLKARQLNMSAGTARESFGSIVVDPKDAAALRARPADPAAFAASPAFAPVVPAAAARGVQPPAPSPATAASPAAAASQAGLVLWLGGASFALRRGEPVDFATRLPGIDGVAAEVTSHPSDASILGLRNLGAAAWKVTMPNQSVQTVEAQRNVRLVSGMRIEFLPGLSGHVSEST